MVPIRYNMRSLMVRRATTAATAGGIGLVVFMLASTDMLSRSIADSSAKYERSNTAVVIRTSADNEFSSTIADEDARVVATLPGIAQGARGPLASSELVVSVSLLAHDGGRANVQVRGVPDHVLEVRNRLRLVAGRGLQGGADEALIGEQLLGRLQGVALGSSFAMHKGRSLKVVGVFRDGSAYDSEVWVDRELLRTIFPRKGHVSSVYAQLESSGALAPLRDALDEQRRLGLRAMSEREYFELQTAGTSTVLAALGHMVSFFFAIAALLGAMITMYAAVANRRQEIGTLRAIGFSQTSILLAFLAESVATALIGGAVGALAAAMLGFVDVSIMHVTSRTVTVLSFEPAPTVFTRALVMAAVIGALGGLLPAWHAARISPTDAMRV